MAAEAQAAQKDDTAAVTKAIEDEKESRRHTSVDYSTGGNSVPVVELANEVEVEDDGLEVSDEVEVEVKKEWIRVNYPIEEMTYGREVLYPGDFDEDEGRWKKAPRLGNLRIFNFEEGVKYLVDKDVADHLRSLGYVYEF